MFYNNSKLMMLTMKRKAYYMYYVWRLKVGTIKHNLNYCDILDVFHQRVMKEITCTLGVVNCKPTIVLRGHSS